MVLRVVKAVLEAGRRSVAWGLSTLFGNRQMIRGRASNLARENILVIVVLVGICTFLGLQWFSISIASATFSLLILGGDATLVSSLLKILRIFFSPLDELALGSILTGFTIIAFVGMIWNYFKSQLDQLL